MVEQHKEENGELRGRERERTDGGTAGKKPPVTEQGKERKRESDRERDREERGSSASLPHDDRQCSKGQPHCTTRYCTIHRIQR